MNLDHLPELNGEFYTTELALDELKSSQTKHLFEIFSANHKITILNPDIKYLNKVVSTSKSIGQIQLSSTDTGILALALMLSETDEILLLTDDYGLRNVAHELKLNSSGVKTKGGKQLRKYNYICTACNEIYQKRIEECDICGNTAFDRRRRKKA